MHIQEMETARTRGDEAGDDAAKSTVATSAWWSWQRRPTTKQTREVFYGRRLLSFIYILVKFCIHIFNSTTVSFCA